MDQIIIGFTGTRNGLNKEQKDKIIELLNTYYPTYDKIIVLHGDCVGADTDFHNICRNYEKIEIHIYPPNNPMCRAFNKGHLLMEEKPYLQRNADIVKNCSILIACPIDKNKEELRSGTWSTIRQARKNNLLIYLF